MLKKTLWGISKLAEFSFFIFFDMYVIIAVLWRYNLFDRVFSRSIYIAYAFIFVVIGLMCGWLSFYFHREKRNKTFEEGEGEKTEEQASRSGKRLLVFFLKIWLFVIIFKYRTISAVLDFIGWQGLPCEQYSVYIALVISLICFAFKLYWECRKDISDGAESPTVVE